jgi:hypothetical protein
MKITLSSRTLFSLGFILLVATNIVVLSGVASNRSGEPVSQITLTERELQLPDNIYEENSGLALQLTWRTLDKDGDFNQYSHWAAPAWLNAEKLKTLGFNPKHSFSTIDNEVLYMQALPREVFVVLEKGGEPYKESLKRAEAILEKYKKAFAANSDDGSDYEYAEKQLKHERLAGSRLFAIDAGLDLASLRDTYGDQSRFIITKGLIRAHFDHSENEVFGRISGLSVKKIHVPLKQRKMFDSILAQSKDEEDTILTPRYEVALAFGKRLEPWIVSVKKIK